jgi:hypothetical protein
VGSLRRRRGGGRHYVDRFAVEQEAEAERKGPGLAAPVFQGHHVHAAGLLHPDHRPDPAALDILQHQPRIRRHLGQFAAGLLL